VTLDGHRPTHLAQRYLRREDPKWVKVKMRSSQYLNNIVELDYRAIKRRCASMLGFKSFTSGSIVLAGIELANRIPKHQFSLGRSRRSWSLPHNELWRRALAC
jgi:transposase-like protein